MKEKMSGTTEVNWMDKEAYVVDPGAGFIHISRLYKEIVEFTGESSRSIKITEDGPMYGDPLSLKGAIIKAYEYKDEFERRGEFCDITLVGEIIYETHITEGK